MATFVPVEDDPFVRPAAAKLEPVDFDPFAGKQMAPGAGPFPPVTDSGRATIPANTDLPESPANVRTPAPSSPPVTDTDPGILAESYGDTVKGLHSTKRGAFLTGYMTGAYDDVDNIASHLAASKEIEALYPSSPNNRKAAEELERIKDSGAGGILPSLGVYAKNPRYAVSTAAQSLPSMLASLVTVPVGAVGGGIVAGPPGAVAGGVIGVGVGSAASDFGNAFEEYVRDKWKPQDAAQWKAILLDPEKTREAGNYAALHAGMVGLFDAFGSKLGGKIGGKIVGDRIANTPGRVAASAVAGAPVSAAVGAGGEAAGQLAGGGNIRDPGAVAGEFAGSIVTDVASAGVEPTIKALGVGEGKRTPAGSADIAAATQAVQGVMEQPPPEAISGQLSMVTTPVDGFYSPARRYVEEKGSTGTADQWRATLRNAPGVKEEELRDIGLDNYLAQNPGKITKQEMLDFLDENAIRIEETARDTNALQDGVLRIGRQDRAQYEQYTLPGERKGYTELTFHMPTRNVEGDNTQRDFVGGHYTEPNVIAHARVTEREDANGVPLALIEEIQSDWHQQGRKEGYRGEQFIFTPPRAEIQHDPNGDARFPWRIMVDGQEWNRTTNERTAQVELEDRLDTLEAQARTKAMRGVPQGPFQTSWPELAFKRMLRWAADRGYRRVAWVNAAEQSRRYPGDVQRDAGMVQFYDKTIPSIAKRWAKRLGGTWGTTQVEGVDTNYIDLPAPAVELIQRGLPLYSALDEESKKRRPRVELDATMGVQARQFGAEFGNAVQELVRRFALPIDIKITLHNGGVIQFQGSDGRTRRISNALGLAETNRGRTTGSIHIALGHHKNAAEVWATITHELGHIVMEHKFATAPAATRLAVRAAYDEWKTKTPATQNMQILVARRDNAVVALHNMRRFSDTQTLAGYSPQQRQYWTSFEEWFAEQVARWATSSEKPITTVEKFFKALATTLRDILKAAKDKFGLPFEPSKAMMDWLDSFHTDAPPFAQDAVTQAQAETLAENQKQMGPEETAVEQQPETVAAKEAIDKLFNGGPPKEVKEAVAYADKFNKIYKWALGIHQVADRNKHIQPLQEYTETIAVAQLTKQQIMIRAQEVLKAWNRLGETQADNVANLIDDVQNMVYLTDDEVKNKVVRFPTTDEMTRLIAKHKVTSEGVGVFKQIADTFNEHLTRYEAVLRNEANKITNPDEKLRRMDAITRQIRNLRAKPYFPAMRFGDYTITVRNDAGQVIHFETFERERTRNAAAEAIRKSYGVSKDQMQLGKLDRSARPLLGVPTTLLEMMAEKLALSTKQRDALEQLKFELSPAQSFKHRFQHKRRVAGYSQDFRRAYANYFFHGANHLMKAMYADRLRGLTKLTKEEVRNQYDATTRHEIVEYMNDHLTNWLDPKSDWAAIRSIAFLWSLAWSPAAAMQNLTQTLMTTYPFLAQQFGDAKAVAAIMKAGANFTTYYKKGTLTNATDFQLRAISRGIQDGIINEAMAPELAGFAEGRTLGMGFGGNELQRGLHTFNQWGAKMFELAEQVNRRLSFRAALDLAQSNPGAKYVKDSVAKHKLHYDQLRNEGWTEAEASAYVAARDAVITTQFQYGREYAPRMFRGKLRSIFVFKTFIQSYVLFLATYPQAAVRSLLIMGALGGLLGLPGGDDLREILKAIGWRFFGKDFDLDREARRMIIQLLGEDENGRQAADMILHGIARQGYGIPAFMDMLGGTVGVDIPMPTFDRSAALSAGTLLPVELGKLFGPPTQSTDAVIAGQAQKASGAVFGAGFNIYKALTNQKVDAGDTKRWERAVPRALGSLAKAYRVGTEGRERNSAGATVVNYDVRDTEQLMEVIGMAAGYTPYRQSLQWNRIMAGVEVTKLWDVRRTGLMKQMGNAVLGKDPKEVDRVREAIKEFNAGLPNEARGKAITSDALKQSIGTQARSRAAQEAEGSVKKSDIPILREVQKLYPQSQATAVRRVPKSQLPQ